MLVDTSSRRSYRRKVFYYSDYDIPFNEGNGPRYYRQQKLHMLTGGVDDFIERAPDSIQVFEGAIETRSELVEIDN